MADSSFETEFLQTHNTYRKQHGAPPLTINKNLCRSAQAWAEHLLSIKILKHSNKDYGENLYYAWSSAPKKLTGREAVESWYSEIKDYNFSKPGFSSATGHFTQVVWKDTKELGVGLATDGNTTFVVGQYLPAGNVSNAGYFERNVLPAGSTVDVKPTPVGEDLTQFSQSFLEAVNNYRRQHGARPLSLSPSLSKEAQDWAAHLISIKTLKNSGKGHGESMLWTYATVPPKGKEVADTWYKESAKYNFTTPGFQKGTGNFTQMIWKSTDQVGVGRASDKSGIFITVAFYKIRGNITNPGYFKDNVKPAGS